MPLINLNKIAKKSDEITPDQTQFAQDFVEQPVSQSTQEDVLNSGNPIEQVLPTSPNINTPYQSVLTNNQNNNSIGSVISEDLKSENINNEILNNNLLQEIAVDNSLQTNFTNINQNFDTLETIFQKALALNASDIHISSERRVVARVNGLLNELNTSIISKSELDSFVMQLIQDRKGLDIQDLSEVDLGLTVQGRRFRINIYRESGSFAIAIRIITDQIRPIDLLGLPPIVKQLINQNSGLFLVTGPTGSGKSTTIASLINYINTTRKEHIITLEDPIEFIFPSSLSLVDQREHGIDFKNWSSALRSILRQDPDIVFVGEMRDYESIASTVTISETGHLVFATLHTNSAAQTIDRIIDVFPNEKQEQIRTQLSNVISGVISQRLVPTIGGSRTLAYEIMVATPAVKNAIRESKAFQIDNIIQTSQDYGMISLERSLAHLVRTGVISLEVAQRTANNREALNILLKQN